MRGVWLIAVHLPSSCFRNEFASRPVLLNDRPPKVWYEYGNFIVDGMASLTRASLSHCLREGGEEGMVLNRPTSQNR